ncbi:hypothetical protein B0H16DRAFT_1894449 [Mycena metata]|uniref:Uncharacterized protein n=1 Tax=Mycena metata TaxID=1033252 RepID=A0AAD7MRD5_9AGAR|nr:hypothetical protein B0H16DRAFT_1894449 [Mycena metata]
MSPLSRCVDSAHRGAPYHPLPRESEPLNAASMLSPRCSMSGARTRHLELTRPRRRFGPGLPGAQHATRASQVARADAYRRVRTRGTENADRPSSTKIRRRGGPLPPICIDANGRRPFPPSQMRLPLPKKSLNSPSDVPPSRPKKHPNEEKHDPYTWIRSTASDSRFACSTSCLRTVVERVTTLCKQQRHSTTHPEASKCIFTVPAPDPRADQDLRPNPIPHALPQRRLVIPANSLLPLPPRMHVLAAAYAASVISAEHALSDAPVSRPRHLEDAATSLACNARPPVLVTIAHPPRRRAGEVPGTRLASVPPTPIPARFDSIHRRLDRTYHYVPPRIPTGTRMPAPPWHPAMASCAGVHIPRTPLEADARRPSPIAPRHLYGADPDLHLQASSSRAPIITAKPTPS